MKPLIVLVVVMMCVVGCSSQFPVKLSDVLNERPTIVIKEDKCYLVKEISDKELNALLDKDIFLIYEISGKDLFISRYLATNKSPSWLAPNKK